MMMRAYEGSLIDEVTITGEQIPMIDRCMDTMDLWYGSALMMIWMLTKVPLGSRHYSSRGWCNMEFGVGSLCTPSHMALDLGLLEDMTEYESMFWFFHDADRFKTIGKSCAGKSKSEVKAAIGKAKAAGAFTVTFSPPEEDMV